uniref:F-box domain-containing protein n=1 Tax=Timema cristinae TaxID=61476 RepID=A0A7R9HAU7_TIMCR|nr:unnamed protein product [Timema cristinae]
MELQTTRMISANHLAQDQPLFTVVRQPFLQECSIQERIFKFLTYEEISLMRSVCQKLAVLANYMLHTAFQRVGNTIEGRLHHIKTKGLPEDGEHQAHIKTKTSAGKKMNDKHLSKCHALYVTAVEYRFVRAVCLRYLRLLSRCFFPGRLLDYFYRIVRITTEDQAKERSPRFSFILMDIVDELTFLVERFIRWAGRERGSLGIEVGEGSSGTERREEVPQVQRDGRRRFLRYREIEGGGSSGIEEGGVSSGQLRIVWCVDTLQSFTRGLVVCEGTSRVTWRRTLWGNNSTQVGVKIVDLLDCCLGSTCLLTVHYSRAACRLTGRYLCPLTGYFTCLRDLDQAESYTTGESDLGAWLSDLRELIRKSNQLYIEDLMKELRSENPQAPSRRYELPLFAGRRKSLSRNLSQDGLTCRETVERVLEPGTGPSFGYTSLAIQVRAQFPMWQWPLDLEPLGSLLNHLQITEIR